MQIELTEAEHVTVLKAMYNERYALIHELGVAERLGASKRASDILLLLRDIDSAIAKLKGEA